MTLKVDIKYKSNAQQGSLKGQLVYILSIRACKLRIWTAKRKNKWICALKAALAELDIYGPSGNPSPKPTTSRYTLVPWELVVEEDRSKEVESHSTPPGGIQEPRIPVSNWRLTDSNIALVDGGGDVFDEASEVRASFFSWILCRLLNSLCSFGCATHREGPIALPLICTAPHLHKKASRQPQVFRCPTLFTALALRESVSKWVPPVPQRIDQI